MTQVRLNMAGMADLVDDQNHKYPQEGIRLKSWFTLFSYTRHELLHFSNRLSGIESLGACTATIHDCVAPVDTKGIPKAIETLLGFLVARINDPTVGLHEDSWSKVLVTVPPVRWARCGATGAHNALIEPIQFRTIFN
uniref:Uncharacterized protein n=1 Tax=Lutzomyia longipalpis TaxID=7200 RepID=A0A1B0CKW6_LUTLO